MHENSDFLTQDLAALEKEESGLAAPPRLIPASRGDKE
jgi:hypothetical protein